MATASFRAAYRARQVLNALWPRIDPGDLEFAHGLMTPDEERLFTAMERRDQRHALAVMRRLGEDVGERDALIAALLHDCGKDAVPVWLRVLHVIWPKFGEIAGSKDGTGWRASAYRLRHHVELSAQRAREAGCSARTQRLIAGKSLVEEAWIAHKLRTADDLS